MFVYNIVLYHSKIFLKHGVSDGFVGIILLKIFIFSIYIF